MEASPFLTILSLPPELILGIADHLPPDALISLKLAHSKFYNTLPAGPRLKRSSLTPCARLAIRTYLESPTPNPSHIRCVLCKALYPPSLFNSSSSPACVPLPDATAKTRQEVVELPERFCAWHQGTSGSAGLRGCACTAVRSKDGGCVCVSARAAGLGKCGHTQDTWTIRGSAGHLRFGGGMREMEKKELCW
ncbi:hypothetical protein K432DRAFT_346830 [Lepidopterella palustris CBS 459.81]|uniref:F-box domain-containing protein n=1 Tax=Lepidopterella palustris CBS 459.81 TaxID=1314670 RepID=A0A8E2JI70_9PEZI|nr:hypothetical protein K432DRAFT_346830 [Lepidopterella palustris CBS 459.81]